MAKYIIKIKDIEFEAANENDAYEIARDLTNNIRKYGEYEIKEIIEEPTIRKNDDEELIEIIKELLERGVVDDNDKIVKELIERKRIKRGLPMKGEEKKTIERLLDNNKIL